jgi:hypothetical protein
VAGIRSDSCALACVLHQRLGVPLCRKRMTEGRADNLTASEAKRMLAVHNYSREPPRKIVSAFRLKTNWRLACMPFKVGYPSVDRPCKKAT